MTLKPKENKAISIIDPKKEAFLVRTLLVITPLSVMMSVRAPIIFDTIAAEKYLAGTNLSSIFTERIKISDIKKRRKAKLCILRVKNKGTKKTEIANITKTNDQNKDSL